MSGPDKSRKAEILAVIANGVAPVNTILQADTQRLIELCARKSQELKQGDGDLVDSCFWVKCLARALLAQADGVCWLMRQSVVENHGIFETPLSAKRLQELSERKYNLPFIKGVKLALRYFPQLFQVKFDGEFTTVYFRAFQQLAKYREGIAHPSRLLDLSPIGILRCARPAAEWFLLCIREVFLLTSRAAGMVLETEASLEMSRYPYEESKQAHYEAQSRELLQAYIQPSDGPAQQVEFFLQSLSDEVDRAQNFWLEQGEGGSPPESRQYEARIFVRVLFSAIEGAVLAAASLLTNIGKRIDSPKKLLTGGHKDVAVNIALVADAFGKHFGGRRKIDRGLDGWRSLPVARSVRNRITHPKSAEDLHINREEIISVMKVALWYRKNMLGECMRPRSRRPVWRRVRQDSVLV